MAGGDELLKLALSRPGEALAEADRILAAGPDAAAGSVARQARAIVLRDAGRYAEAIAELRRALRLARRSGLTGRAADVQATLGLTLAQSGRTTAGLAALNAAVAASTGPLTGRVLYRRGFQLAQLGRRAEALADLNRAIRLLHRAGDAVWEGRARTGRFIVYETAGQAGRGRRDLIIAERLYTEAGQVYEAATVVHNRADIAVQEGDLPAALALLDEAGRRYAALGVVNTDLTFDRCHVLLAAGLAAEAFEVADAAARDSAETSAVRAKLLFAAARAAQAAGWPAEAIGRASAARDLFRRQRREWWAARAAFVLVQARYDAGARDGRTRAAALRIADRLGELGAEEAPAAHLLAGRLAAAGGRPADAERHLELAARLRRHGPSYAQAAGWLAEAIRADARGATPAALRACRRGLLAAAGHQRRLGAVELRVRAAAYGTELAAIGQRHAVRRGDPRMLLQWSEQWRAGALTAGQQRTPEDSELDADLAALRAVMSRLDDARAARAPIEAVEADRRRLEQAIRSRTRRAAGNPAGPARTPAGDLLDGLDGHLLIELVALDGTLHAVTARHRRTRLHQVGPLATAVRELELARFMLRRLAHGRPAPGSAERLAAAGHKLEAALLGPAAAELDGGPVVIAPAGVLHAVPWGMLPGLSGADWSVVPSAATWWQARQRPAPRRHRIVIVVGPGLPGTGAEVTRIAGQYPGPTLLGGGTATALRVLGALDGAATAHIAAHGVFRGDNPLFSSLRLDDGPLTLHDLGRLRRGPHQLILSSCESGVAAPAAGDELLGVLSVLIPLGTASLLASVVPVNDDAAARLMTDFHTGLRAGHGFGAALLHARILAPADPVDQATALAFVALGA